MSPRIVTTPLYPEDLRPTEYLGAPKPMFPPVTHRKTCTACEYEKPLGAFPRNRTKRDGRDSDCKRCKRDRQRSRYADGPGLDYELKRRFGISLVEYRLMLLKQGDACAICRKRETAKGPDGAPIRLAVDHSHDTGKVRGLLCSRCNTAVGLLGDSTTNAVALVGYLHQGA